MKEEKPSIVPNVRVRSKESESIMEWVEQAPEIKARQCACCKLILECGKKYCIGEKYHIMHFGVAMPDGSVWEAPFCTMNTLHRPRIEKLVAKKVTQKVRDEFDTSVGQARADLEVQTMYNGGSKIKEEDGATK